MYYSNAEFTSLKCDMSKVVAAAPEKFLGITEYNRFVSMHEYSLNI